MTYLNENGSLDVERINKLPIEEYMEVVGNFTNEQREEYYSKSPINESTESVRSVAVNYTLEEDIEKNGTVLLEDLLNNLNKRYGIK